MAIDIQLEKRSNPAHFLVSASTSIRIEKVDVHDHGTTGIRIRRASHIHALEHAQDALGAEA
jgi:hypothetical protein